MSIESQQALLLIKAEAFDTINAQRRTITTQQQTINTQHALLGKVCDALQCKPAELERKLEVLLTEVNKPPEKDATTK